MSALGDFLAEHMLHPWQSEACHGFLPGLLVCVDPAAPASCGQYGAAAGALYKAWAAYAKANGMRPDGPQAFGSALQALPWVGYWREEDGRHYRALTVKTRRERAEESGRFALFARAIRERMQAESEARHRARRHADGSACACELPVEVRVALLEARDEAVLAMDLDPAQTAALAAWVEAHYGAYLRWRPGDPEPQPTPGYHHHALRPWEDPSIAQDGPDQGGGDW